MLTRDIYLWLHQAKFVTAMFLELLHDQETGLDSRAHDLHSLRTPTLKGLPPLLCSAIAVLKFIIIFEHGALDLILHWASQIIYQ